MPTSFSAVDRELIHRLDAVTLGVFDCPHSTPQLVPNGPLVVRTQDILTGILKVEDAARVTEETYRERVARAEPSYGDLLYSREGTYFGIAAEVPKDVRVCLGQRMVLIRPDPSRVDHRYLKYWLNSPKIAAHIQGFRDGSVAERLNLPTIRALPVLVRPLPQQHAIAGVLGALDDKVEQNRRTARALERLALAIFRAWFVDFEPVKAKATGAVAFPSMPQPVFDALPTRFVDSAIGRVPEGWEVSGIGDVVNAKGGGTPSTKKSEFWDDGEHYWATPKDMSRLAHPVLLSTERRITDAGVNSISSGILPVGTVLMSSRAPVGYLAIAGVPTAINQGFIAMVCDGPLPATYVLNWAIVSLDAIKAHASGTTFPEISKKSFRPLPVIVPTPDVVFAFQQTVDPLYELLTATVRESDRLVLLRDYLLPQLMSGAVSL